MLDRLLAHLLSIFNAECVQRPSLSSKPLQYVQRTAVFVPSSRWEALSRVLIEAVTLGTLVVATDCPSGPAEILEGGRWGRLVPVGDVERLAKAIKGTLFSSSRSMAYDVEKSAIDRIVCQYVEVLDCHETP